MKNEGVISRIISAIKGDKIAVRENLFYNIRKGALDFELDDLPNWNAVLSVVPVSPDPVPITAHVTTTPLTVPYDVGNNPLYSLKRDDNSFDWNTGVVYDGTSFIITGDDDGSGKFADDFVFQIKP